MKNLTSIILFCLFLLNGINKINGQNLKACDVVTVAQINSVLGAHLTYDPNSIINKSGKFECRYTDPSTPGTFVSIGLLSAKIDYGYDMLKTDFDNQKREIGAGRKAVGKYTKFFPFPTGGATSFYMTGEKDDYSPSSFSFKFRKGDYIVSLTVENLLLSTCTSNTTALFNLFSRLR